MYSVKVNDKIFFVGTKMLKKAIYMAVLKYVKTLDAKDILKFYLGQNLNITVLNKMKD